MIMIIIAIIIIVVVIIVEPQAAIMGFRLYDRVYWNHGVHACGLARGKPTVEEKPTVELEENRPRGKPTVEENPHQNMNL